MLTRVSLLFFSFLLLWISTAFNGALLEKLFVGKILSNGFTFYDFPSDVGHLQYIKMTSVMDMGTGFVV